MSSSKNFLIPTSSIFFPHAAMDLETVGSGTENQALKPLRMIMGELNSCHPSKEFPT